MYIKVRVTFCFFTGSRRIVYFLYFSAIFFLSQDLRDAFLPNCLMPAAKGIKRVSVLQGIGPHTFCAGRCAYDGTAGKQQGHTLTTETAPAEN